jgi:hypothetical protein
MKRLFYQSKMYDYSSKQEAEEHIRQMKSRGWYTNTGKQGEPVMFRYEGGACPYFVEFIKYGR